MYAIPGCYGGVWFQCQLSSPGTFSKMTHGTFLLRSKRKTCETRLERSPFSIPARFWFSVDKSWQGKPATTISVSSGRLWSVTISKTIAVAGKFFLSTWIQCGLFSTWRIISWPALTNLCIRNLSMEDISHPKSIPPIPENKETTFIPFSLEFSYFLGVIFHFTEIPSEWWIDEWLPSIEFRTRTHTRLCPYFGALFLHSFNEILSSKYYQIWTIFFILPCFFLTILGPIRNNSYHTLGESKPG